MEKLGNRRVTGLEQYYTPEQTAMELVEKLFDLFPETKTKNFLEPAGGTGSFLKALEAHGIKNVLSVDTHPRHAGVQKADFLSFTPSQTDLVTISNPPFGRNNALSIPFFNHAAKFSSHIAFLVPRSWRKWSVTNRLDLGFEKVLDLDVNLVYVNQHGEPLAKANQLRTCFQIWRRAETLRERITVPESGVIEKVSPHEADVALRVFGFGCGKVLTTFERKPNTTLIFLRLHKPLTASLLAELDYDRFKNNTAYTQALSFQEINYLVNEKLFGDGHRLTKG